MPQPAAAHELFIKGYLPNITFCPFCHLQGRDSLTHALMGDRMYYFNDENIDVADNSSKYIRKPQRRHSRRLSDKILIAFEHACDHKKYEVASQLLQVLEFLLTRDTAEVSQVAERRKNIESLVDAHKHLWALRNESRKMTLVPVFELDMA